MSDHLIIFDTTLRDGEQSPGASMTKEEKLRIARQLERLRVDVIEAGFPASSNGDFEAVQAIAKAIKRQHRVRARARQRERHPSRRRSAASPRSRCASTRSSRRSPIHMEKKLRMTPDQVFEQAVQAVGWAREYTDNVEFSPEDAGRSELDFLCRMLEAVIDAGATTINIPDTVGYTMPGQFGALIASLRERIPNSDKAVWSVHCHNDLGLAVANSLAAVHARRAAGRVHDQRPRRARRQCVARGDRHGGAHAPGRVPVRRRASTRRRSSPASKLVSGITGFPVQPNKAIVGANAFAHESGIHQDGVLKHRETYEIMRAEDVGWSANKLVLGKLSGRNAFKSRLRSSASICRIDEAVNTAFARFKELADKKREIFDEDLHALVSEEGIDARARALQAGRADASRPKPASCRTRAS